MTSPLLRQGDGALIEQLRAKVEAQRVLIREQEAALAHSRKIFERASAAARIGVWECDLPSETLRWTDVVYDIFDLPRGSALDRREILLCYPEDARKELERVRSRAIEERGSFSLDTEIVTPKGHRRWLRITATVECENDVPVRIFGMKQDITEEKALWERMRYLAEFDVMTGLANRSRFQARLAEPNDLRDADCSIAALMLVDLDGFKQVNDGHGHVLGDECLKEAARRLAEACREAELVARIGGDEFAVLLGRRFDRDAVERLAREVVAAMSRPVVLEGRSLALGASVGVAEADGRTSADLFAEADAALYAAKAAGRNTYRILGLLD